MGTTVELTLLHDLNTYTLHVNAVQIGESGVFASVCTQPRCTPNVEVRGRHLKTRIREFDARGQNYHHVRIYAYHATHGQVVWAIDLWAEKICHQYGDGSGLALIIPPIELYKYVLYADFSVWFWSAMGREIKFDRVVEDIERFSLQRDSLYREESQFCDDKTELHRRSVGGLRAYINAIEKGRENKS